MANQCAALPHVQHLEEKDTRILQRLVFETNGYNTLIREFTMSDVYFNLEKDKWEELLLRRDRLIAIQQELLAKVCGPGFTGNYSIDFSTCELSWG